MTKRAKGLKELDELEAVFSALAHPSRRQILTVLRARGGTMTSGELAARFECSWPTTTRHLRLLTDAGLIQAVQQGRERHYELQAGVLASVAGNWISRFQTS